MAGRFRSRCKYEISQKAVVRLTKTPADDNPRQDEEALPAIAGLSAFEERETACLQVEEGLYLRRFSGGRPEEEWFASREEEADLLTECQTDFGLDEIVFFFGRSLAREDSVSRRQFVIVSRKSRSERNAERTGRFQTGRKEFFLIDLESANGTYRNGRRIEGMRPTRLEEGDWIFASGFSFFFFSSALLSLRSLPEFTRITLPAADSGMAGGQTIRPELFASESVRKELQTRIEKSGAQECVFEPLKVEAPDLLPAFEKPSWFSCLGSSALIVISSMSSLLAMVLRNPADSASIQISAITSLSMAAAFLGYGLISRTMMIRSHAGKLKTAVADYEQYLSGMQERIRNRQREQEQEIQSLAWLLGRPDPDLLHLYSFADETRLPVRVQKTEWPAFALPEGRYSQKKDGNWKKMETLRQEVIALPALDMVHNSQIYRFDALNRKRRRALIFAWLWTIWNPKRKWVEIGETSRDGLTDSVFSWHPAFWIMDRTDFAGVRLQFERLEDFLEACAFGLDDYEWTIHWKRENGAPAASGSFESFIPSELAKKENVTWLMESPGRAKSAFGALGLPDGFRFEQNGEGRDLLSGWENLSEAKLRQTLCFVQKDRKASGWDERLFDPETTLSGFRDGSLHMKVRLSPECSWDLIEEGPHALIAGMTGSGKSEGLISVLLQLCLYNPPELLQIICIDFKGSALASVLSGFPHTAGVITNLEENAFVRLEAALRQELDRRQRKIREWLRRSPYNAGDLDAYNADPSNEPLSHLVIAVDEFAQLKSMFPSAMKMLQETARIGRSLGIHLVLATQKPAGVVDEQIWTNAASHLCFRVASGQDSREMLGHEQAASLSQAGDFILQVLTQDEEKRGRALYSRSGCFSKSGFSLLSEDGAICKSGRSTVKKDGAISVQERISSLIGEEPETKRNWILHPDFEETDFRDHTGLIDRIDHMEPFRPAGFKSVWMLCASRYFGRLIRIIRQTSTLPVYWAGANNGRQAGENTACREEMEIDLHKLWNFERFETKSVLIVEKSDEISPGLLEALLNMKSLHLIVLSSEIEPAFERLLPSFELRMASSTQAREQIFAFFQDSGKQVPSWPLFLGQRADQSGDLRISLNSNPPSSMPDNLRAGNSEGQIFLGNPLSRPMLDLIRHDYPGLIGFECSQKTYRPICRNEAPLLIAYRTPEGRKKAEELLNLWTLTDPKLSWDWFPCENQVAVISLTESQNLLMDPANEAGLYQREILFLGEGAAASQYLLKRPLPMEISGDAILFGRQGSVCLNAADCSGLE